VNHALYHEIAEQRGIPVSGKGRRPQVITTSPVTATTADPTETSTKTKVEEGEDGDLREDDAKTTLRSTPVATLKRSHSSPPSSAEQDKPMKKRPKHGQVADKEEEDEEEQEQHQPLIIRVPRAVIDKALKGRSNAPRVTWSPVNANEVALAFTSPDVMARAQRSSWSPSSAAAFLNRYQYPLVAFVQGLWCDEKDTERAVAANKAALFGDATLRLQTLKRIDKLVNLNPEQQQEFLDTVLGRECHNRFLHRTYGTTDPSIASWAHKHYLSSQIEHAIAFAGFPKLVRPPPSLRNSSQRCHSSLRTC
jgi:hypothetical protein